MFRTVTTTRLFRLRVLCRALSDDTAVIIPSEFYAIRDVLAEGKPVEVGFPIVLLISCIK
jgi:hypothetical protein